MTFGDSELPLGAFAIALFIGALVGIEREKKQERESERGIGGLRTFILFAQAGAVAAWLSTRLETPWVFVGTGALVTAVVLAGYVAYARAQRSFGLTTEVAAIVVYLLGGTVVFGYPELAVALAIATAAVLAFKEPLHGVVERIGRDDLYAGLQLLIATFIVLPILPNRTVDPWGAINPYRMWWLVILISGLSLVGYVATRWLGAGRGIPLTGFFGGLVSSTAVTLSFARRSQEEASQRGIAEALSAGILIAWAVSFARILGLVAVVHAPLLEPLALPLGGLGALAAALAAVGYRASRRPEAGPDVPLSNPFSLPAAMRFALLFAAVLLAVALVRTYLPGRGLYAVAALAGLTDVDAIALSMAGYAREGGDAQVASRSIVIAALSNTLTKAGLVVALGSPALRRRTAIASALLLAAAALLLLVG